MLTSSLRFAPTLAGACRISVLAFIATGVAVLPKQHPQMLYRPVNSLIHVIHPLSLRLSAYGKLLCTLIFPLPSIPTMLLFVYCCIPSLTGSTPHVSTI
jgi:hypothetical protein